ncbi:MAG: MBL fold metallo-hydrolase [Betaproteobacteria bacterium]|nr:MBL fold metallo-hydrolase [Betaproteobacteria bacterium]
MRPAIIDYDHGISALDSGFIRPWLAAIYLIVEEGRAAIVDTGSNACADAVLAALTHKQIAPERVDYVILTHIHLDHAGGAGLLMCRLPHARLCVHPRGVRHMVDPERLIQSTVDVYGAEHARTVYGDILPVPEDRIVATPEGACVALAGRELRFIETPGHARHHCCIVDAHSRSLFAGDTFGLAYRELEAHGRRSVFPTTSPVQFDPEALHASIDRIVSLRPERVFVTHFGGIGEIDRLGEDLHRLIDAHVALARAHAHAGERRHALLKQGIERMLLEEAKRQAWPLAAAEVLEVFATDIELNAQGLGVWLDSDSALKAPAVP